MEHSPKICIPLQLKTTLEVVDFMQENAGKADLFEIWLDQIIDLDLRKILEKKPKPVLCVCKTAKEKGAFQGNEMEKVEILKQAMALGADYVDIDYQTTELLIADLNQNKKNTKLILSYHNFELTPDLKALLAIIQSMLKQKPDLVKIATMANSYKDSLIILNLAQALTVAKIPYIAIAMSEYGKISRVLTPLLGSEMMFAPLENTDQTASGQIAVEKLKMLWREIGAY